MSDPDKKQQLATYWLEKAENALASARSEYRQERYDFTANRAYYAAFYAATAVFIRRGLSFHKHSGVRAAIHRELVKGGAIEPEAARWYRQAFDARQESDYHGLTKIDALQAEELIVGAERFVKLMRTLLSPE